MVEAEMVKIASAPSLTLLADTLTVTLGIGTGVAVGVGVGVGVGVPNGGVGVGVGVGVSSYSSAVVRRTTSVELEALHNGYRYEVPIEVFVRVEGPQIQAL